MPTPQLRAAYERMIAANNAVHDYATTEPLRTDAAYMLLRNAIKASREYMTAVERYVETKKTDRASTHF